MIVGTFIFYLFLFVFVFSSPEKLRRKDGRFSRLFIVPALIALLMTFLSVIKVFFIYKILLMLFGGFTLLMSYWQWGDKIKRWLHR